MVLLLPFYLSLLLSVTLAHPHPQARSSPQCRFSPSYTQSSILSNPEPYISDLIHWEAQFHTPSVGYNPLNGMTYDGTLLNPTTGERNTTGGHPFSAASKEALQIMVYAHALAGHPYAVGFVSPNDTTAKAAGKKVVRIMKTKLETYLKFNETYPGFGGFIPWFLSNYTDIRPTLDWVDRVPALDNGELLWAVYAAIHVLETSSDKSWEQLAAGWQAWLDYAKLNAAKVFYHSPGIVCAVTTLNQTLSPNNPAQNYSCENPNYLNDPYEGELFTFFLYLFSPSLTASDKSALITAKRPQLVAVNYTGPVMTDPSDRNVDNYSTTAPANDFGPVTVQKGFWFSSHETWKLLEMPYLSIPIIKRVFLNGERVRTCNSVLASNPGMYASVNNVTNPVTNDVYGYISAAGIPPISNQTAQELDVITPYAAFPTILFNKTVGLAWWKNMVDGKGMQNPFGSTESTDRDGSAVGAFISWDSKVTTVVALLGGVGDIVKEKMKVDGVLGTFESVVRKEYETVFANLVGEDIELCLPNVTVPDGGAKDFSACS